MKRSFLLLCMLSLVGFAFAQHSKGEPQIPVYPALENEGDCWLRILEFKPDGKTIGVRTFSPLFALSKLTKHLAWRTADYDQFEIVLE